MDFRINSLPFSSPNSFTRVFENAMCNNATLVMAISTCSLASLGVTNSFSDIEAFAIGWQSVLPFISLLLRYHNPEEMTGARVYTGLWSGTYTLGPEDYAKLLSKATGIDRSACDLMLVGKQIHNTEKAFNKARKSFQGGISRQLEEPSNRRDMLLSFLSTSGDWSCSAILLWGVLAALGYTASIWIVIITMAVGEMVQMIPIPVPGMIGIYETSLTASLITFSVPASVSASAAILLRLITSVFDIPATGYAAYRYGYRVLMKDLTSSKSAS
jgi:uncharacterized membrane protein YbhN (UPF0104 family)